MSELYRWLVESLWASFGYDSPETHAKKILEYISGKLISGFRIDLKELKPFMEGYEDVLEVLDEKYEERLKECR